MGVVQYSQARDSLAVPPGHAEVPLIVDVDGTLVKSDLLMESALKFIGTHPLQAWRLPLWLGAGKARLKDELAGRAGLDISLVPLNEQVVDRIQQAHAAGRPVHLASAGDRRLVQALADRLGLSDEVFASDGRTNLAGPRKAEALVARFGEGGFDYIGNDPVDYPVWERARRVLCVGRKGAFARQVERRFAGCEHIVSTHGSLATYIRALRPHQWAKNGLLALPMLVMHKVSLGNLWAVLLAWIAFSLVASSVYLINDMADLDADRRHARKRRRPFASGDASLLRGLAMVPVLMVSGFALATVISWAFMAVLLGYFVLTLAYSFNLKRRPITDVIALGGLYMVRVFAGGVAIGEDLSFFMLAFCLFFFLCLALVKRWAELLAGMKEGQIEAVGRGYRTSDIPFIGALAVAAGYAAVVVLALYVTSDNFAQFYARPEGMWFACVIVLYWVSRILFRTHRGRMHDDPVVWALKDKPTYILAASIVVLGIASKF